VYVKHKSEGRVIKCLVMCDTHFDAVSWDSLCVLYISWRQLCNEEVHNLYSFPDDVGMLRG
jgi:hypothetical protein